MTIRAMWVLLISVATTIAHPALGQIEWAETEHAVATVAHEQQNSTASEWIGMASITLDSRGHIIQGFAQVNGTLLGWDYVNDPVWLQRITCQKLTRNVGATQPSDEMGSLALFTCSDFKPPLRRVSSALGLGAMEGIFGALPMHDPEPNMDTVRARTGAPCTKLRGDACEAVKAKLGPRPEGWGVSLGRTGRTETFIRVERDGSQRITHVIWASE